MAHLYPEFVLLRFEQRIAAKLAELNRLTDSPHLPSVRGDRLEDEREYLIERAVQFATTNNLRIDGAGRNWVIYPRTRRHCTLPPLRRGDRVWYPSRNIELKVLRLICDGQGHLWVMGWNKRVYVIAIARVEPLGKVVQLYLVDVDRSEKAIAPVRRRRRKEKRDRQLALF